MVTASALASASLRLAGVMRGGAPAIARHSLERALSCATAGDSKDARAAKKAAANDLNTAASPINQPGLYRAGECLARLVQRHSKLSAAISRLGGCRRLGRDRHEAR